MSITRRIGCSAVTLAGLACTPSAFSEGANGVGDPRAPIPARPAATPVFEPNYDPEPHSASPAHAAEPAATTYTCPMHPEIVKPEPGSCPICGMKLVPKAPKGGEHQH